jgi:uncharacterized protein
VLRVTADINIVVSGLNFPDGHPNKLLELARAGDIELAVSAAILDEMTDVLTRQFDWPEPDILEARRQFGLFAKHVAPTEAVQAVKDDPDDNAILECAIAAGSQYIVSGDRHLLQMGTFRSIPVLKVAAFLELVAQERTG